MFSLNTSTPASRNKDQNYSEVLWWRSGRMFSLITSTPASRNPGSGLFRSIEEMMVETWKDVLVDYINSCKQESGSELFRSIGKIMVKTWKDVFIDYIKSCK